MTFKILVSIDLADPHSWEKPLPVAFEQAKRTGGDVTAMTVVPELFTGLDWRYAIRGELKGSEDVDMHRMVDKAEKRLNEIVREHLPKSMKATIVARHGTIYDEVLDVAEELGIDQILMTAHRPNITE